MNNLTSSQHKQLMEKIHELAAQLPGEMVEELAAKILATQSLAAIDGSSAVINAVPNPRIQEQVEELLNYWQNNLPEVGADSLAFALLAVAQAEQRNHQTQTMEIVWTGPQSQVIHLRRTDQALLQLIREAGQRLLVVSFAVYKVRNIVDALIAAARRGVAISIVLESPDESEGKLTYDAMQAMGAEIRKHARFYTWPLKNRPLSPDGKHGSLHAKAAVADGSVLFISSANLTEYAMNLNMELGVIIRGGELPNQIDEHYAELVIKKVLTKLR
jgi:phosphatidylserine/phosphatidylglycerophosphate/cardiolipin synthase-like enzyme